MPTKYQRRKTEERPRIVGPYLNARDFRNNRLWRYDVGEDVLKTEVGGKWLTSEEFDRLYPVPRPLNFYLAAENPDTTRKYLL